MRILLACAAFPPFIKGGGPVTSLLHAKALMAAGHDVLAVNVQGYDALEEVEGVPVRRLRSLNIYWNYYDDHSALAGLAWHALENFNPQALLVMRKEIQAFRPDVVVTISIENVNVATWLAARQLGVPVIHCMHSYFLLCWRGGMFRSNENCADQCVPCRATSIGKRFLSHYVDGIHAETQFVIDAHVNRGYFPRALTRVIPGPVSGLKPPRQSGQTGSLTVGFIGAHTPNKGIETLARAAQSLRANPRIDFIIAGAGDSGYSSSIRAMFPIERTRFTGWIDPDEFYPHVDVIVVPSVWNEPFARTIVEAFSFGIPVLGARSGGIPGTIRQGENGFLFDRGDHEELGRIIAELAADPAQMSRLSRQAAVSGRNYTLDTIGQLTSQFYEDVIAAHRSKSRA
jgi:glycosyltransferase involved in cell wall biosynthesis